MSAVEQNHCHDQEYERNPANNTSGDDGGPCRRGQQIVSVAEGCRDDHVRLQRM